MSTFRYSRWDGTQQIMPFDADAIMEAISEDVMAHGDIKRALEKLMQQGYKFQSGERMPGLRDMLDRLKQRARIPCAATTWTPSSRTSSSASKRSKRPSVQVLTGGLKKGENS